MRKKDIVEKWECSSGLVVDVRRELDGPIDSARASSVAADSETHRPDGSSDYTLTSAKAWGYEDFRRFIRSKGQDPDEVTFTWGVTTNPGGGYWNKLNNVRPKVAGDAGEPLWPVIQPARDPIVIKPTMRTPRASRFKTAVLGADTQIGFDMDGTGNLTPYHDERAIDILHQVVAAENPDQTVILGDILDLTEQGRWSQEEPFARTTQPALNYGREFAAQTRANTTGRIIWIEGNHDKRMQAFMEANAKAAMGLRKAGYPDSWPVMSIPNLIGLDEFDTEYIDAYPAGVHWITDGLRAIHGTKANSKGSTASQYANEMPHISTAFGHTHRLEVQSKTTFDRAGKIRTMAINPGCLCRVDGAVPSVHGARHLDGSKATYWEDWQQGVAVIRYHDDGTFYVELVQIDEGVAFHAGDEIASTVHPDWASRKLAA
jgi:predicted phosphodiesterase